MSVRQVVLKLNSRCNLACTYCYVYESVDEGWRRQPVAMSRRTLGLVADRIAEHLAGRPAARLTVTLHGDFTVQTNALLLNADLLEVFARHGVRVGVSLDGDRLANDRHRRFRHGGGSYDAVAGALELLTAGRFRHLFSGLLCTVDVRNDPLAVYEALLAFAPPRIDFLLPHGNWTAPPPFRDPRGDGTPYADWLIEIFERWYSASRRPTDVRLFGSILSLLLGGPSDTEAVGVSRAGLLVIESDGSIEQTDSLKTTENGMAATGLHVATASFTEALGHPAIRAQHAGLAGLAETCRGCEIVSVCGGGLYAHRYRQGSGFANPTVYCPDQLHLIGHIRTRLTADVQRLVTVGANLPP
jgi:uncharacterized protein